MCILHLENAMKNKKIPIILNCDTGIDDAVAIMLAVKSGKIDIKLIVTDVGNVPPVQAAINTNNILELIDAPEIPVVAGSGKCFAKERPRPRVHGGNGLGEFEFEKNDRKLDETDAIEKMYQVLSESDEKVTIISLSPIPNLARLLKKYPECAKKIERLVLMAGTTETVKAGDMPYPEFNVACDPEASEFVFASGIPIEIVPMEMGHTAYLDWQDVFNTKNENYTGYVLEIIFRSYKDRHVKNGIATHDGCAVSYVTNPEIFEVKPVFASVEYFDSIKSGVLVMDFNKEPNVKACTKVNIKKFKNLYYKALRKCK